MRQYPSDLSDAEWATVVRYLPRRRHRAGRRRVHARRVVLNAVFYVVRTGCQWRQLPRHYPPWQTVYHYFRCWRLDGTWARLCAALRERVRAQAGRNPQPTAAVIDSQSVKTTAVGGLRSWDGHKRVKGRKRHILVDGQGLLLRVVVHGAAMQDGPALPVVLAGAPTAFPRLRHLWADRAYAGQAKAWVERELGWTVALPDPALRRGGWVPAWTPDRPLHEHRAGWRWVPPTPWSVVTLRPRRWVVERTFAWLGHSRRLSKDYERCPHTSEAIIYAATIRLLTRRLASA